MPDESDAVTRALLVCAAPVVGYGDLIRDLALESDVVIAVDGGALLCRQASVTPDLVVGDLDSIDAETLGLLDTGATAFIKYPADKDDSDLDLAVAQARSQGITEIVVCAAFSGRLDHTLAAVGTLASAPDLRPEIVEPEQRGWILSSSHRPRLDIGPIGATISVLALCERVVVSMHGVRWPLVHERLSLLDSRTLSNVTTHADAYIQLHSGVALVVAPSTADTATQQA